MSAQLDSIHGIHDLIILFYEMSMASVTTYASYQAGPVALPFLSYGDQKGDTESTEEITD